ncbi:MAG: tetratricopeptide repeat protein [Caulobacterales bacterium]|nr:tetratricopeptide repeat protein [Caulobacterales bacterium]
MVRVLIAAATAGVTLIGGLASAQEVERTPVPDWVEPLPLTNAPTTPDDAPIRMLAVDEQIRLDAEGVHTFYLRRIQVQTRQGLPYVSTVSAVWTPPREKLEVHAVRIIRGDQVIDALEGQTFQTLRREDNLESSMLDGRLTATLQPRDVRVGDILETAFTIHDNGGVLAPHREALSRLSSSLPVVYYRMRASWPVDMALHAAATSPWTDVRPQRLGRDWVFQIEARDLAPEHLPENLPGRFQLTRTTQITDMADWSAVSTLMAPLYARAETLEPDSPLTAEIERIRAAHDTDGARAAAALRLVQDEVRYLALSMGEGGYVPMSADEVWRSRYGDCKGKTVLLLALLHGLGIEAEAAMVSTGNGDGLPERPPVVGWFDHVIVRATIDGQVYWMDGARVGDRDLAELVPPPYRWGLPVRAEAAAFLPIEQPSPSLPNAETVLDADASAGLDAETPITMDFVYRGDAATQMRQRVGSIPRDQLETLMRASIDDDSGALKMESFDTRYDDAANVFHLIFHAKGRLSWVNTTGGRVMGVPEAAVTIPNQPKREGLLAPYADHPYALYHPFMNRVTVRVRLPNGGQGFSIENGDQVIEEGGYRIERRAVLNDGVAEVTRVMTSLVPEISAEDMDRARKRSESLVDAVARIRAPAAYVATEADRARLEPGDDAVSELIDRAEALWESGDNEGALALLDAAVVKEPDNVKARRTRGDVRLDQNDFDGAREDFDHAVEWDPVDVEAAVGQGRVAMAQGRYAEALVSFTVALRLDPTDATALSSRGASYHQIGRWDRSLADYRALKTVLPDNDLGLFGEARALIRLDRADEARTLARAKLDADPTNLVALTILAEVAKRQSRFDEALAAMDAGLASSPGSYNVLNLRAELRARSGDDAGAKADFATLRAMSGGNPALMNNVCWNQGITGFDLEQALADCDLAVATGEASIIDSRAMVLLHLGRYEDAKAAYDQALAGQPNQSASLYGRGLARLALGDAGGRDDLDQARRLDVDVIDDFAVFEARHPEIGR